MLARFPSMLTYLPAAIALWVAINLLVVLWLGAGGSRRAEDEIPARSARARRRGGEVRGGERVSR